MTLAHMFNEILLSLDVRSSQVTELKCSSDVVKRYYSNHLNWTRYHAWSEKARVGGERN